jgi:hypothetical protein
VLRFMTAAQRYIVLEQSKASDGVMWYRVDLSAIQVPIGWVSAEDVVLAGNCATLKDSTIQGGGATVSPIPPTVVATATQPRTAALPTQTQSVVDAVAFTQTTTMPVAPSTSAAACVLTPIQAQTRVHIGPGRNRTVLRFVTPNDLLAVLAQAQDSTQMTWYRVDLSAANVAVAWVAAEDVKASGDCSALAAEATATPVASATPTSASPTVKAAATIDPARCAVASSLLQARVHLGPGRNRTVLRFLTQNQQYLAVAQVKDATNMTWYRLDLSAVGVAAGWVAAEDVTASGNCAALPTS